MSKIIIIGAGLGGLTAGNLLARKGHQVTIFEAHSLPGGYTAGFWRKGFYFESGTLSFESSDQVFKAMDEIGVREKISFVRHEPFRFVSQDFDAIPTTYAEYKQMFYKAYPADKERLTRYFSAVDQMYAAMSTLASAGVLSKITGGLKMLALYLKYTNLTTSQFAARYFEKDAILYRHFEQVGYPDMPAFIIGGALWSLFEDYWTVKDGMQAWADVLADNFRQLGGDLKLRTSVDRILTREGAAMGVRCQDSEHEADYVISACDYKKTFLHLLDPSDLPQPFHAKVQQADVSEGVFVVYLGLNIAHDVFKQLMKSSYVMYKDVSAAADVQDATDEQYFAKAPLSLYSSSLENPKLAPDGKSSLMLVAMSPYRWMNNWGGGDRQTYQRLKAQVQATLIERAAAVIPNLKDLIEYQDAATPLTFERFTGNTDGATSAWSWNPNKKFYKHIFSTNVQTPVKNLLIGSCWATQIGGIPGALGAARACSKKIG